MGYNAAEAVQELQMTEEFLFRVLKAFDEADATFTPAGDKFPEDQQPMSVAAQVAHIAITIDWFVDRWDSDQWDLDFCEHMRQASAVTSIGKASEMVKQSFARARARIEKDNGSVLEGNLPADDPIMPHMPRWGFIGAISDHTAHHRGSLATYLRLLGRVPPVPYMDA